MEKDRDSTATALWYIQGSPGVFECVADQMNDDQLKKILNGIAEQIVAGLNRASWPQTRLVDGSSIPKQDRPSTLMKSLQITGSILAILAVLWAGLTYVLSSELKKAFDQPNKDFALLRDREVGGIQRDVGYLRKDVDRILDRQAAEVLHGRAKLSKTEEIKEAATRARDRRIVIDPSLIRSAAAPMLVSTDPANWEATTALLNLRSFVNSTLAEAKLNVVGTIGPGDHGKWFQGGPEKWVEVLDLTVILDGKPGEVNVIMDTPGHVAETFRNIIFKNCHIVYRGGSVKLVDVFFDNCDFEIADSQEGRAFAKAIIEKTFPSFSPRA